MAILGRFTKQSAESLRYEFEFVAWLADRSTSISGTPTVVAAVYDQGTYVGTPAALTISAISQAGGIVTFWATGGTSGVKYEVTCTFNTAETPIETKQDEMIITIKDT